ncbi:hypothetical protein D3C87_1258040 [compost metagenome]
MPVPFAGPHQHDRPLGTGQRDLLDQGIVHPGFQVAQVADPGGGDRAKLVGNGELRVRRSVIGREVHAVGNVKDIRPEGRAVVGQLAGTREDHVGALEEDPLQLLAVASQVRLAEHLVKAVIRAQAFPQRPDQSRAHGQFERDPQDGIPHLQPFHGPTDAVAQQLGIGDEARVVENPGIQAVDGEGGRRSEHPAVESGDAP